MVDRRPLASPGEVADYLGVTEPTLKTWRYTRTGPKWSKVGRHVRYRWSDVDAWLDRQAGRDGAGAA
ncbi:MAG TPA: helix-turn-helix domain-containing protein [Mycobacteriales bacterium]|nr:helix-turn-helix domain-containing protein [Mycobacteriales bacterium]